jgi:hypothetical protein
MYQSNYTPSPYTLNALVQCTGQRSVLSYGLLAALLFLCLSVTSPASAQEPAPVVQAMGQTAPEWIYIQITKFNDGKNVMLIDDELYSYEKCQQLRDERTGQWKYFGDHTFVKSVVYICVPKRVTI